MTITEQAREIADAAPDITLEPVEMQAPPNLLPHNLGGLPYLGDFARLADAICKTEMVPQMLRGRADAVLAVVMAGFELGIGPMQSLQSINLIQGKPSLSAELMRALIIQAGHQFRPQADTTSATVQYRRKEWAPDQWSTVTFTIEDAQLAGLVEWYERWTKTESGKSYKQTWNPYGPDPKPDWVDAKGEHKRGDNYFSRPRAMLSARATSEAARLDFADVIAGLSYTPDEVEEFAPVPAGLSKPGEVAVIETTASPAAPPTPTPEAEEAMHELAEIIRSVEPEGEREKLTSHLRGRFGPSAEMTLEVIREATKVAAGWPDTAKSNEAEAPQEGAPF